MYAVIFSGGKQYKVSEGDLLRVEKLEKNVGDEVVFDKVLMLGGGSSIVVDASELSGKTVTAKVVEQANAKKVVVGKYKKRKKYRRKIGHRQPYTSVVISKIDA